MKARRIILSGYCIGAVSAIIVLYFWSCTMNKKEAADMVLLNGVIFTSRGDVPVVQAVAIKDGKILEAGSNAQVQEYSSSQTKRIDLGGKFACPGFNDAHLHFMGGGLYAKRLDLLGCGSPEEVAETVRNKAGELQKGAWILGRGWDQTIFPGKKWPTKDILDTAAPENPVFLRRVDGHIAWVNSYVLKLAGITGKTKDPQGGEFMRDEKTGEPTGILKEAAADLVYELIPKPSKEEMREALEYALNEAKKYGITSIQDNSSPEALEVYDELEKEGKLTIRVSEWLDIKDDLAEFARLKARFSSPEGQIRFFTLKSYVDGTLGSRTAAMLEPYTDDQATKGFLQVPEEKLKELVKKGHYAGFQIALHAIGDRAVRAALDSFEPLRMKDEYRDDHDLLPGDINIQDDYMRGSKTLKMEYNEAIRSRIEHAQVISPEDIPRFKQLEVIASMQPVHCISDKRWAEERIGKERSRGAYAWRSILSSGAKLCFGTDWPVESMNPMLGLYAAVTRMSLPVEEEAHEAAGNTPQPGTEKEIAEGLQEDSESAWMPQERLTIEEALKCYTAGSAYAESQEDRKGTLEKGKYADIVVLSNDLLKTDPRDIPKTEVLMTIFDGKVIFERG